MKWRNTWLACVAAATVNVLLGIWFDSSKFVSTGGVFFVLVLFLSVPAVAEWDEHL